MRVHIDIHHLSVDDIENNEVYVNQEGKTCVALVFEDGPNPGLWFDTATDMQAFGEWLIDAAEAVRRRPKDGQLHHLWVEHGARV